MELTRRGLFGLIGGLGAGAVVRQPKPGHVFIPLAGLTPDRLREIPGLKVEVQDGHVYVTGGHGLG